MTTRTDRDCARSELLTTIGFLTELPAPADAQERALHLAHCEGIGAALVEYFCAESAARLGDPRKRQRLLGALAGLLETPPDGSESRDQARLVGFHLVLSAAAMHLQTQASREALGLEAVPS